MTGKTLVVSMFAVALLLSLAQCGSQKEGSMASSPGGQSGTARGNPAGKSAAVVHLKSAQLMDREGAGIEVLHLLIPSDWTSSSRVNWLLDVPFMPATVWLLASNPGGTAEFELLPNQVFAWSDNEMTTSLFPPGSRYYGAEIREPVSAQDALRSLVLPRYRADVSDLAVVKVEPMPELAKLAYSAIQPQPGLSVNADAAKARITYRRGGREFEEEVCTAVECYSYQIQTMNGPRTNTQWYVDYTFSCKAEKGTLDKLAPTFAAIAHSITVNPVWLSKLSQLQTWLAQQQIERIQSVGQLSRMLAQTSNEVSDMMMDSYNKRQAANDRIAQNFSDYTLGIDRYNDPGTGTQVELPSGYNVGWSNGHGEYILTDQTGYNPNEGSTQNWQQMTK